MDAFLASFRQITGDTKSGDGSDDRSGSMSQMRKFSAVALIVIVTTQVVACTRIDPGQGRANDAWSQRLAGQAQAQQQEAQRMERAQAAWSQRLTEQADAYRAEQARVERAHAAYAKRLTRLPEHLGVVNGGMSDLAKQAWTDRLNGLAEHYGVGD